LAEVPGCWLIRTKLACRGASTANSVVTARGVDGSSEGPLEWPRVRVAIGALTPARIEESLTAAGVAGRGGFRRQSGAEPGACRADPIMTSTSWPSERHRLDPGLGPRPRMNRDCAVGRQHRPTDGRLITRQRLWRPPATLLGSSRTGHQDPPGPGLFFADVTSGPAYRPEAGQAKSPAARGPRRRPCVPRR